MSIRESETLLSGASDTFCVQPRIEMKKRMHEYGRQILIG